MENTFRSITNECRTPTTNILRKALLAREGFSREQSNLVTYLAGFTHYQESKSALREFGLTLLDDFPAVYEKRSHSLHIKTLVIDGTVELKSIWIESLSDKHHARKFRNPIWPKNQDGSYVDVDHDSRYRNLTYEEYIDYLLRQTPPLTEELVSLSKSFESAGDLKLVCHFSSIRSNTRENMDRLWCNLSSVLATNGWDDMANFSTKRMKEDKSLHSHLRRAKWYVIDTTGPTMLTTFLSEIGADYAVLPYTGDTSDYVAGVIEDLQERVMKSRSALWD